MTNRKFLTIVLCLTSLFIGCQPKQKKEKASTPILLPAKSVRVEPLMPFTEREQPVRYFEIVTATGAFTYGEEYVFELRDEGLIPLNELNSFYQKEAKQLLEQKLNTKLTRHDYRMFGATLLQGEEYLLLNYQLESHNGEPYQEVSIAYQPDSGTAYYSTSSFKEEGQPIKWEYLGKTRKLK